MSQAADWGMENLGTLFMWRPAEGILRTLLVRQGYRCFWCGYPIVELSQVNRSGNRRVLAANETHVIYYTEARNRKKRVFRAGRANVDHLVPKWMGGDSRESNVVASCVPCNQGRGRIHVRNVAGDASFQRWARGALTGLAGFTAS